MRRRYTREADRLLPLMLRRTGPLGGTDVGSAASDVTPVHGALRGLTADDHLQYMHTALPRTISATHNFTGLTGFTSPDQDSAFLLGRAKVGLMAGAGGKAGFAHRNFADSSNFALMQDGVAGNTSINAAQQVAHQIAGQDVLTVDNSSVKVSGTNRATLQSDTYASQLIGWSGTYDGAWDVRYLFTDQMHAKIFAADLARVLAGIEIISKSVTLLGADFTVPYAGAAVPLTLKDLPSARGMPVFEVNDLVDLPMFSRSGGGLVIGDCWGTVSSPVDNGDGTQTWTFTRSGTTTYNTITQRTGVSTATLGTTLPINRPTGTSNGDFLLAYFFHQYPVASVPSGWLPVASATIAGGTLYAYYKVANNEPANWSWTFKQSGYCAGDCKGYTNVSTVRAIDQYRFGTNAGSTSMGAYGVDPSSAAGMLIFLGGIPGNIRATPPAGMNEGTDFGSAGASIYQAYQLLSSDAATGTKTATLASAAASVVCQIVLAPTYSAMSSTAGIAVPMSTLSAEKDQNSLAIDYGVSGNGWLEHNAVDGLYAVNAPYFRIVNWATHPATGKAERLRMGNLNGLSIADYGLVMGSNVASGATTTFDFRSSTGDLSLGTADQIVLQGNGNSYFGGVMTIGTSGEIRQGSGSAVFTPGVGNFTGLRIWNSGGVGLIGGYNAGTQQWYVNTDGKLYAGAGDVILDSNGLALNAGTNDVNKILWKSSGTSIGNIWTYQGSTADLFVRAKGLGAGAPGSNLYLEAHDNASTAAKIASLTLNAGATPGAYFSVGNTSILTLLSASAKIGSENASVDARLIINGTTEFAQPTAANFRSQLDVDNSTVMLTANEYYAGGWALYDSGKAPARITLVSNSADSNINFYTKAANTAQASLAGTFDKNGNLVVTGTIKTTLGVTWDLGGYTAGAPAATGYVTVKLGGTTYKFLTST